MNDELLFVIPIYSMPEEEFDEKWDDLYEKRNYKNNDKFEYIREYYKDQWKYNQIIAYVEVYKSNEEINFNICKSQQKIYRYDCSQHYFTYCHTVGQHFYVDKNMTHSEIVKEIKLWVDNFAREYSKRTYVDYELFNKTNEFIDLHKIFYRDICNC